MPTDSFLNVKIVMNLQSSEFHCCSCYFVVGLLQNKKKLVTYVIASGVMYGEGENVMRYLFHVRRYRTQHWLFSI